MDRTIIIDGDVVLYKVAEGGANSFEITLTEDDDFVYQTVNWGNKESARRHLESLVKKIVKDCKGSYFCIALSDRGSNFRKELNPDYKGKRKPFKPALYDWLRRYLEEKSGYKIYVKPNLEADDVIGILATSDKIIRGDKVVWSLDKDFKTIPCKFHKAKPNGEHESKIISEAEADWWFMYQTLVGDPVDGYSGCKGIGDKTARKLLGEIGEKSLEEMWKVVLTTYEKAGMSEQDTLLNARMARILRAEDYDFKKKEVKLWQM